MCRFGCYMMKASERSISSSLDVIHTALCMVIIWLKNNLRRLGTKKQRSNVSLSFQMAKMSTKHSPFEYHPAASTQLQRGTQAAGPYKPRKGL